MQRYFLFQCPHFGEHHAAVNPHNNLAHCFCCGKNVNNIDLLVALGYDFLASVTLLEEWLLRYERRNPVRNSTPTTASK